jgi:hypothetical protein
MSSLLLVLLAACGVPDQRTGQQATTPPMQPTAPTPTPTFNAAYYVTHPELWPTHSPADMTQAALIDGVATAIANVDATSFSLPPAPQDAPLPVYPTATPQPDGIRNCQSVDIENQFAIWNCWQMATPTQDIVVSVGGESGVVRKVLDPSRYREDDTTIHGGVMVCVTTRGTNDTACDPPYWRPEKEGRLKVVAAEGMRLTLEAVTGSRYVFNVDTRQWEAAPAIPVPTATPLATEVPPPTFTPLPTSTDSTSSQ